jgi:hypothetical protein
VSNLRACGPLTYTDNKHAKQLLYALDAHAWGYEITALEESTNFATLDTEKLFSKLKSYELSRKDRPNHDPSFTSKALITSACIGTMMLTSPISSHFLRILVCLLSLQLPISNTRAFPMIRLPCL